MSRTRRSAYASHFLGMLFCGNHSASALALTSVGHASVPRDAPTPRDDCPFPNPISPFARTKSSSRKTDWISRSSPGVVLDSPGAGKAPCNRRCSEIRGFRQIGPAVTRGSMARIKLLTHRLLSPGEHPGEGVRNSAGNQGLGFLTLRYIAFP